MRKRALTMLLGLCMTLFAFPLAAHAEDVSLDFHICPEKAYYVVGNEADPIFVAKDNGEDGVAEWYSSPTGSTDDAIKISRIFNVMGNVVYEGPTLVGYGGWSSVAYTPPTDVAGVNWYYLRLTDATGDIHVTNRARIEVANELYDVWVGDIRITDLSADDVLGDADEGATVTYDPDTHTLKLDNANITSSDEQYAIYATHDLTIELAGTSTVTLDDPTTTEEPMYGTEGAEGNCVPEVTAAIACEGSLTVKSADASNPGTLEVTDASSSYETESPSAIYAAEDVTIRNATVSASSETGRGIVAANFASYDSGVKARSEKANGLEAANATISGGSVTLSSTDGIAMNVAGNLTAVSDCTLTLDGGKGALAAATFDSGGQNWYQWVTSPIGIPAASLNETYSPAGRTDTYLRIEPVGTLYELTVAGGTGSGIYLARNQITISADPVNDSSHFSHWEVDPSGAGTLADPSSATTTFTMPVTGVTITAVYEPHTLAHHDAKSPTCIDTGWKAYDECTACSYSTFKEIPTTDHDWSGPTWSWSADGKTATATFTCRYYESHRSIETATVTPTATTTPSCTEAGVTTYTATVEFGGRTYTDTKDVADIPAAGHGWGEPEWSWPADGKSCTATFTCENDATHKETPEVTVASAVKTPATCTEAGVTAYTATVEFGGRTYTDTKDVADIPAAGHKLTKTETEAATCTKPGNTEYWTCGVCDKIFSDGAGEHELALDNTVVPATGHSWGEDGHCAACDAVDPDFTPAIIAGADATWQKGSGKDLAFTSNAAYGDFMKVQVDGKDVDAANYSVGEGSTVVTLKASYLETLSAGKHTLGIVSKTGVAETEFTIAAKAQTPADEESLAATGDASALTAGAFLVIALSLIGAGTAVLRKSRS